MKGYIKNIGENVEGNIILKIEIDSDILGIDQLKLGEIEITYSKTKQGKLIDDSSSSSSSSSSSNNNSSSEE